MKLRYSRGWRLPGGGRRAGEKPEDAVLRELREEIGLTAFGTVRAAAELEQRPDHRRDLVSLLIVDEVIYRPRWSLEIERVMEVPLDALPCDIAPVAQAWIDAVIDKL